MSSDISYDEKLADIQHEYYVMFKMRSQVLIYHNVVLIIQRITCPNCSDFALKSLDKGPICIPTIHDVDDIYVMMDSGLRCGS